MVELGSSWEFDDDLLGFLDFPMESLEGDELAGDWDISNLQCLGPIPSIDMWPIDEAAGQQHQHQVSNHVDTSSSHFQHQNKLGSFRDSAAFKIQSPVSVLESPIPVRSRSKRVRSVGVNPWLLASPEFPTSQKGNENQKKSFQLTKDSPEKVENLKSASSHRSMVTKKCHHCESTKTPQWREGPLGPKTLCNACGVRYRSGRLFPEYRPVKSPTFAPTEHSNSHKKVIEMRNKQPAGIIKAVIQITEAPEQKQLSNHICQQNKFSSIQESVSILESKSQGVNPLLLASKNARSKETLQMPRGSILAVPVQSRKRVRPKRLNDSFVATSLNARTSKPFQHPSPPITIKVESLAADEKNAFANRPCIDRKCAHCETTKTPQWREGPKGLLCNACGVRYRKGRLFPEYRPADSPTFVPSKHSNSHKRVVEMRKKAKQVEGKISTQQEAPFSPQPEFVPMSSYFFDY